MRRRGLRLEDQSNGVEQCNALRAGVATLEGYTDFEVDVIALAGRATANALTTADRAMLDALPVFDIPNMELIHAYARFFQKI